MRIQQKTNPLNKKEKSRGPLSVEDSLGSQNLTDTRTICFLLSGCSVQARSSIPTAHDLRRVTRLARTGHGHYTAALIAGASADGVLDEKEEAWIVGAPGMLRFVFVWSEFVHFCLSPHIACIQCACEELKANSPWKQKSTSDFQQVSWPPRSCPQGQVTNLGWTQLS